MNRSRAILAGAAAAYLAFGLWVSSQLATWTDEEYTLATTAHGPAYAFSRAISYELQAPLYFVVLSIWREADASVWFARAFSLLCATAFVFVAAEIGRRVDRTLDPLPFALFVAFNPVAVYAALEIRLYALALLISGLMWLAFDSGFVRGANVRARLAFVALAVAGTYVQYFVAFALAGYAAALLVAKRRSLLPYVVYAAVACVAILPLAVVSHSQVGGYETAGPSRLTLLVSTALHPWLDFIMPYDVDWTAVPGVRIGYYLLLACCAAIVVWSRPRVGPDFAMLVASAVTIELVYLALVAAVGLDLASRYFVALFVPLAATAYRLFAGVLRGPRPQAAWAFAPAVILTVCVVVVRYAPLAQPGDWKRTAAFLERHAQAGDVVAVYPPDAILAFARQYRGVARSVPFPRAFSPDRYSVDGLSIASEAQGRAALAGLDGYRHVWLVDATACYPKRPLFGCEFMPAIVTGATSSFPFFQTTVYEFDDSRRSGAQPPANGIRQVGKARNDQVRRP